MNYLEFNFGAKQTAKLFIPPLKRGLGGFSGAPSKRQKRRLNIPGNNNTISCVFKTCRPLAPS